MTRIKTSFSLRHLFLFLVQSFVLRLWRGSIIWFTFFWRSSVARWRLGDIDIRTNCLIPTWGLHGFQHVEGQIVDGTL